MNIFEIILLALCLAMDAFAVSICKGLAIREATLPKMITVGLWFGSFQAIMPLIGYFLGDAFKVYIENFDHWVAFVLLVIIGVFMIKESFSKENNDTNDSLCVKVMLPMAIATSIDALAVGISFGILPQQIHVSICVAIIGIITLIVCAIGVKIGSLFGIKYKSKAEICGGIVLILIAIKILIEHLTK